MLYMSSSMYDLYTARLASVASFEYRQVFLKHSKSEASYIRQPICHKLCFQSTLRHGIFLLSGGNMLCCNGNRNSNNVPKSAIRLCPDALEFSRNFETLFLQYICNITFPHLAIVSFLEFYRVNIVYIFQFFMHTTYPASLIRLRCLILKQLRAVLWHLDVLIILETCVFTCPFLHITPCSVFA